MITLRISIFAAILTVKPATLDAESRSQIFTLVAGRQVVQNGGHSGNDERQTPGVHLVQTKAQQFLALLERGGPEVANE